MLAGGNVQRVINAMIAANKADIDLPWQTATAIDLAGRDILDAVQTSVNPKVIDVPNPTLRPADHRRRRPGRHSASRQSPRHRAHQHQDAWSAEPPKKPSSPASAKASSTPSARPRITSTC